MCLLMQLEKIEGAEIIEILNVSPIDDLKIRHLAQVKMTIGTITQPGATSETLIASCFRILKNAMFVLGT